ncbi:MAG TPA: TonB family protein, partial [Thermoanaerobaculia bacterium]|nr:TonB family protein [Thermoanaerobaculia bacterium]
FERVPLSSPLVEPLGEETVTARPGAKFGQFVLVEKIATGGMAEIWKAQMQGVEGFEKIVAIKRILPHLSADQEFVAMFVDEAKIAARLNHPHITHIYDLGRASGSHYIAMEMVEGHDLKSALRRANANGHPMSVELAVFIASRLAAALDYAHRKEEGLVHRDVSPQNVLISWDGDIKLCDFGIAKATSRVSHTQTGALKGKLQYMSPEQASGKPIDRRSDIFSLASVLFEMLTQRKLFSGENEASVLDQVREARVEPPSVFNEDVPEELDRVVMRALAKDPAERYASAGEMARDLDQILYSFRPAPAAADLAVWMHRIWSDEPVVETPVPGPEPEPAPVAEPEPQPVVLAPPVVAAAPPAEKARVQPEEWAPARAPLTAPEPASKKGLLAAALVALVAIGGTAGWFFLRPRGGDSVATPASVTTSAAMTPQASTTPAPAPIVPAATESSIELPPAQPGPAVAAPSGELVDQEVRRRLDLEKQRLEQLSRRQAEAQARQAPVLGRTTPAPPPQAPATATGAEEQAADAPIVAPPAATPPPVPTETAAAQAETAAPQEPPTRRGDYVAPGTPGLAEPELIALRKVTYPPLAKARKIQGIVILQVLVSETGSVIEARVLRGVKPDLGFDAAALDAARGGTFKPAVKDGVPVRTHKTVTVPFKLQ